MDDVHFVTDNIDFDLQTVEACLSTGEVRTGSLSANALPPGWVITSIELTALLDGHEVPPPMEIFSSSPGTSSVNASGSSLSMSASVRSTLADALDSGDHHAIGTRITVHMEDDQGVAQSESITSNFEV